MYTIKVVFIGDSSVGKSALFSNLMGTYMEGSSHPTIGAAYGKYQIFLPKFNQVTVGVWDTAGQERFKALVPMYVRDADIIIFMYDCSDHQSLRNVKSWCDAVLKTETEEYKSAWMLFGNKIDLLKEVASFEEQDVPFESFLTSGRPFTVNGEVMNSRFSAHCTMSCSKRFNMDKVRKLLMHMIEKQLEIKPTIFTAPPTTIRGSLNNDNLEHKIDRKCTNCSIL
jgi:small GTP-binding protein